MAEAVDLAKAGALPPELQPDPDWRNPRYPDFDFRGPDYTQVFRSRARMLAKLRSDKEALAAVKVFYATHPAHFINDWGCTFDPRNLDVGLLAHIPFVLFERQWKYIEWLHWMWRSRQRGQVEKSRDMGVTWCTIAFHVWAFLFHPGFTGGLGSRKADLVDKTGDPKSMFFMVRYFLSQLPVEFLPEGFDGRVHNAHMRTINPETGSSITGEAGDQIGRGGRTSVYCVDEAAFVEHQDSVDAALSQNTNVQIDISTWNGPGNAFFKKNQRLKGTDRLFIFDWRQDPRKDRDWYERQKENLDEVIVAQEIDRDPYASQTNAFIPAKWVAAALDAHKKLGFHPSGIRATAFDPADTGDAKATVSRHGSIIMQAEQLRQGDITYAIPWAFEIADNFRADVIVFDGDGMGMPTMRQQLKMAAAGRMRIEAFIGSGGVEDPDEIYSPGDANQEQDQERTNANTFQNYRAQAWTIARDRFRKTYEAITRAEQGLIVNMNPEDLISIDTERCKDWQALQAELSAPMRLWSNNGKIIVEPKAKMVARGVQSPNLADALVMCISRRTPKPDMRPEYVESRPLADPGAGY